MVVMPDQFGGDPAPNTTAPAAELGGSGAGEGVSLIEQVKLRAAETAKSFMLDMWLARHTPEKVLPILHKVLESAKDEFADAVANGGGVYAVGYCFGGKYVMILAGEGQSAEAEGRDEEEGMVKQGPLIKAGAIAHATLVTGEDMTSIKAPVSIVCVGKSKKSKPLPFFLLDSTEFHKILTSHDMINQKTTSSSPTTFSKREENTFNHRTSNTKSRPIQACLMVSFEIEPAPSGFPHSPFLLRPSKAVELTLGFHSGRLCGRRRV